VEFTSKKRERSEPIKFTLDGEDFWFVPGKKSAALFSLIQVDPSGQFSGGHSAKALMDWLGEGLNRYDRRVAREQWENDPAQKAAGAMFADPTAGGMGPQAKRIKDRLAADEDEDETPLELDTVIEIAKSLITATAERPTGQPGA
jgi:hypothetical protein